MSKSAVSRICGQLTEQFETWSRRRLDDVTLDYLFLDASHFKYHANAGAEPVLAAWGIDTDGKPVFVGLDTAATESGDAWAGFLTDLGERGLTCPLLVVSDGAPGLIAAAEQTMSAALRQRCLIHRARNILAKVPTNALGEVQADYWAIFNLPDTVEPGLDAVALVHKRIDQVAMRWRDSYPAAVRCLLADRDSLTVYLRFPREHWPRVRHSNFIERTFGETRRRVKVIGRLPGEHSVTSLVWAVLDRASTGWRGFTMTAAGLRLLHDLRRTLLQPPAQLRSRGEPTPPPSPAAPSPRPRRSAVPEAPWRDASVTPTCPVCQGPLPTGRARAWCSPRCRQAAYRTRHRPPSPTLTLPRTGWVTDRQRRLRMPRLRGTLAGERRCDECNLFARRLGEGGCCPTCSEIITITELLDIS